MCLSILMQKSLKRVEDEMENIFHSIHTNVLESFIFYWIFKSTYCMQFLSLTIFLRQSEIYNVFITGFKKSVHINVSFNISIVILRQHQAKLYFSSCQSINISCYYYYFLFTKYCIFIISNLELKITFFSMYLGKYQV